MIAARQCVYCNTPLRDEARFCSKCGQKAPLPAACPSCGATPRLGAKFCAQCGAGLSHIAPTVSQVCPICKRPNRPGAVFCAHCGGVLAGKKQHDPFMTGKLPPQFVLYDRYRIVQKVAQGGMSAIYLAVNEREPGAVFAIKEMSYAPLNALPQEKRAPFQQQMRENFDREYEILRDFTHPNLPRVYDYFEVSGRPYIVMDFIHGRTLEQLLKDLAPGRFLPEEQVLAWARQLCDVLDYLHGQDPPIIYRDLKPSNVMQVEGTQEIRLIDFGIARFYKPGKKGDTISFGTEGYLAPEILGNLSQTSPCTDIFALGALLHELLTGRDPCNDPFNFQPVHLINPLVTQRTEEAILTAVKMLPEDRPQTAVAMLEALFGAAAGLPERRQPSIPRTWPERPVVAPPMALPGAPIMPPTVPSQAEVLRVRAPRWRKKTTITLTRAIPTAVNVQVVSHNDWISVAPAVVVGTGGLTRLVVEVNPAHLETAHWRSAPGSGPLHRLPRFLRAWLAAHLQMIPVAKTHQGDILLNAQGAPAEQVEVEVEVQPPGILVGLGWLAAIFLMGLELLLLVVFLWFLARQVM